MWLPKSSVPDMVRGAVADSTRFMFSRSGDNHAINVRLFANLLQLRALQQGYGIITGAGTPRSLLDQTFGHCIPQKSRSHIVHIVEYLMQCLSETYDEAMQIAKQKEEASTNVSVLSGQPSVTVPLLYRLSIGSRLSSYTARRIEQFILSFPFLRLNAPQAFAREGADENGQEAQGQQPGHAPCYLHHVANCIDCTEAFPKPDRCVR